MRKRLLAVGAMLAAGAVCLLAQDTVFRVDVRLVRVLATVKNNSDIIIGDLRKEDFRIFDNGVQQELTLFEHHTEQPLSVAVLTDTSASTAIDLKYELDSVARFLRAMFKEGNPDDAVELFAFNADTTLLCSYTHNLQRLESSLKGLKPEGGTSLYDAMIFASRRLEAREGRHVILVITDGGDTTSENTFHKALEAAQMADAVIYPILVMPVTNDPGRNIGGEHALTLFAQGTGGRVFTPSLGAALDQALSDILRELRTQYLLGYYPKNIPVTKDRFHRLEIRLARPDLRVSARSGYYGESEQGRGWTPVR